MEQGVRAQPETAMKPVARVLLAMVMRPVVLVRPVLAMKLAAQVQRALVMKPVVQV